MKKLFTTFLALAGISFATPALAQKSGQDDLRIGVGVSTGQADVRLAFDPQNAVDVFLDLDLTFGDLSASNFGIGAQFVHKLTPADPVAFQALGGLAFARTSSSVGSGSSKLTDSDSILSIFGGIGAEYFFPNTKRFSIEANVGLSIDLHFMSAERFNPVNNRIESVDGNYTVIGLRDITNGGIKLRYYF